MGNLVTRLLFQPPAPTYRYEDRINFWLFTRLGEKIPAFFINQTADITVLFSHGNAEDLNMIYPAMHELSVALRVNVMGYDYTGYGLSSGAKPSEDACYADADAALEYLTDVLDISPEHLVLFGRSLGSGITCHLAEKLSKAGTPPRGVILECPLLSVFRVAFNLRFTMPGDMFVNVDKAPHIRCPVCIVHGARDEVVPFWHGQQLYLAVQERFRARPLWVDGAGHNDIELVCAAEGNRLIKHLRRFLDADLRRPAPLGDDSALPPSHAFVVDGNRPAARRAAAAAAAAAAAVSAAPRTAPVPRGGPPRGGGDIGERSARRLANLLGIDGAADGGDARGSAPAAVSVGALSEGCRHPSVSPLSTARPSWDGEGSAVPSKEATTAAAAAAFAANAAAAASGERSDQEDDPSPPAVVQ